MLATLLESSRPAYRPLGSGGLSLTAHALVVALALAGTRQTSTVPPIVPPPGVAETVRWVRLSPPMGPAPGGAPQHTVGRGGHAQDRTPVAQRRAEPVLLIDDRVLAAIAAIPIPDIELPGVDFEGLVSRADDFEVGRLGHGIRDGIARVALRMPGRPLLASEVERMIIPFPDNPLPAYPKALIRAGLSGEVVIQYVVDSSGWPDTASVRVLRASHALFAKSVRDVLPKLRYYPASVGGTPVSVLVQQPFAFVLH